MPQQPHRALPPLHVVKSEPLTAGYVDVALSADQAKAAGLRLIKGPDGTTHSFPGDTTDAEISAALGYTDTPIAPPGSDRTRIDTNTIGVDRSDFVARAGDFASRFPPALQKPAAWWAELSQEMGANALEMASSPETLASMVAMSPVGLTAKAMAARIASLAKPAARAIAGATEMLSPDLVGILSPRAGNALRVAQRVGGPLGRWGAPEVIPAAPAPTAAEAALARLPANASGTAWNSAPMPPPTPVSSAAPSTPFGHLPTAWADDLRSPAPTPAPNAVRAAKGAFVRAVTTAPDIPRLTDAEMTAGLKLLDQGMSPTQALQAIVAQREFLQHFPGLPSAADVAASVADRNATGRWK